MEDQENIQSIKRTRLAGEEGPQREHRHKRIRQEPQRRGRGPGPQVRSLVRLQAGKLVEPPALLTLKSETMPEAL